MKLKTQTWTVIEERDFNALVSETYGRPYDLQQQGFDSNDSVHQIDVSPGESEAFIGGTDPVPLAEWLAKDPKAPIPNPQADFGHELAAQNHPSAKFYPEQIDPNDFAHELWWIRDFYPDPNELLDDMLERGLIDPGRYTIHIWW